MLFISERERYIKGIFAFDSRIMTDGRFLKEDALTEPRMSQIRALNDLAAQRGQTLAQMALAWVLRDGVVASVLAGASRPEQILDNIKAAKNTTFVAGELALIEKTVTEKYHSCGTPPQNLRRNYINKTHPTRKRAFRKF